MYDNQYPVLNVDTHFVEILQRTSNVKCHLHAQRKVHICKKANDAAFILQTFMCFFYGQCRNCNVTVARLHIFVFRFFILIPKICMFSWSLVSITVICVTKFSISIC